MAEEAPAAERLRAELEAAVEAGSGRELGSGYQASVRLHTTPAGDIVVKTAHGGPLGRLWRYLLLREHAIYARLTGVAGIPRSFGLLHGTALALEYIAGPSLRDYEARIEDREAFFVKLLATVQAMHSAGVTHGDLKRKNNIVVGPGEQPYLIDFGIACRRSAKSALWNRWVFEPLKQLDCNAWVKLKYGRRIEPEAEPDALSAADAALYRPLWAERAARAVRVPWQTLTLRRPRQRWRARRNDKHR